MGSRGKSHITEVTMTNNNQPNYQKHTEYDTIAAYSWKSHQKYNEYTEYWGEEILCYSRENGYFCISRTESSTASRSSSRWSPSR